MKTDIYLSVTKSAKKKKNDATLLVRLSREEKAEFLAALKRADLKLSETVRELMRIFVQQTPAGK